MKYDPKKDQHYYALSARRVSRDTFGHAFEQINDESGSCVQKHQKQLKNCLDNPILAAAGVSFSSAATFIVGKHSDLHCSPAYLVPK